MNLGDLTSLVAPNLTWYNAPWWTEYSKLYQEYYDILVNEEPWNWNALKYRFSSILTCTLVAIKLNWVTYHFISLSDDSDHFFTARVLNQL